MVVAMILYFITIFCVIKYCKNRKLKYEQFPALMVCRDGIVFSSHGVHRLLIKNVKVMKMGKIVYLINDKTVVIVSNINNVFEHENYLYFTALGKVKIHIDCKEFYKYFNIGISSNKFSLETIKRKATLEILSNLFNMKTCSCLNKYINIITKVLNVVIKGNKVIVGQNKFKLPFVLTYKLNGVVKKINIRQTLEEF